MTSTLPVQRKSKRVRSLTIADLCRSPNITVNLTTVSGALFERPASRGCRLP